MNIPSHYQNDLFKTLASQYEKFEVVYAHSHNDARKAQGWSFENTQNYHSKTIGIDLKIWQIIPYIFQNRKAIHIVNGIWAEKVFFLVIILLNLFGANFLIYSEAPIPNKKRNLFTLSLLNFCIKPISKLLIYRAKGFLAVSIFAVNYFKNLGIENEKIYRFGYFTNIEKNIKTSPIEPTISFIFVGQLIERKGIFTLLKSIEKLTKTHPAIHLSIIGTGDLEQSLKGYVEANNLQEFVTFMGAVQAKKVQDYITKAHLLILPSVFDGWGIVVNEALQHGIPVVISDQCGAKELIRDGQNGLIFEANNVDALTHQLIDFVALSPEGKSAMKQQAEITGATISIPIIAHYLTNCLAHSLNPNNTKPITPWLYD